MTGYVVTQTVSWSFLNILRVLATRRISMHGSVVTLFSWRHNSDWDTFWSIVVCLVCKLFYADCTHVILRSTFRSGWGEGYCHCRNFQWSFYFWSSSDRPWSVSLILPLPPKKNVRSLWLYSDWPKLMEVTDIYTWCHLCFLHVLVPTIISLASFHKWILWWLQARFGKK